MSQFAYTVGIDLGTTHSVVSYVDNQSDDKQVHILPITQLSAPGQIEQRPQLGSFLYQAHDSEIDPQSRQLPWSSNSPLVGAIARNMGTKTPLRLISSAKSWLCHAGVNRRDALLPVGATDDIEKVSPLKATELYLAHLVAAWSHQFPDQPLSEQSVTITVPASFDPAARDLTAEAARQVGLAQFTLLEEPQAALYRWIEQSGDDWRSQLELGDTVLVVDIGGGTTDLSLVEVSEDDGNLQLDRIAVGEHILLGGDNMDLALAYRLKAKLAQDGKSLQPWQVQAMTHACRDAKEALLMDSEQQSVPIVVPSRGSKLLGATLKTELTRDEVTQTLVEGFFPQVAISEQPQQRSRGALTQIGLPYAQDAGITRHIAAFLTKQGQPADEDPMAAFAQIPGMGGEVAQGPDFIKPTAILFNGGVLKAPVLAERLLAVINQWLTDSQAPELKVLSGNDLDLAVAGGAAYYGQVRQGQGVRIRGGLASSYYVGIESAQPAVPGLPAPLEAICIAPFGLEEGSAIEITSQPFGLIIGEPVSFQFFASTTRQTDQAGEHLMDWQNDELVEMPSLQVTLPTGEGRVQGQIVPVTLATSITELGTLKLEAIASDNQQRWQVEFEVRDTGSTAQA